MGQRELNLEARAERWRNSRIASDLIDVVHYISPGTGRSQIRRLLGNPVTKSELTDGGETWTYVKCDPEREQLESLFVVFSSTGVFVRLDRKPID